MCSSCSGSQRRTRVGIAEATEGSIVPGEDEPDGRHGEPDMYFLQPMTYCNCNKGLVAKNSGVPPRKKKRYYSLRLFLVCI